MAPFRTMSVNIAMSFVSIPNILKSDKPDLLFLQEINNSTEFVSDSVTRLGYSVECNVDPLHPTLPGTAILWKTSLKVSEVNQLIERRAHSHLCIIFMFILCTEYNGDTNREFPCLIQ